ncbi:hypothetical protein BLA29_005484 [Euroglyphus maynei]|uniref:Uncharacterized protein n=1 Tax=Euroglyphus maynei TaxID=6958 RepID=A0A1Y3AMQ7_EURMA|nr:hypothetical protein BLA29_005484 [Euroglyphus maynei]
MIKRISLSSLRSSTKDSSKIVKYQTCSNNNNNKLVDDDLDEVAVISNVATPENVRYGDHRGGHHVGHHHGYSSMTNGPRVIPGIITAGVDRTKLLTTTTATPSSSLQNSNIDVHHNNH